MDVQPVPIDKKSDRVILLKFKLVQYEILYLSSRKFSEVILTCAAIVNNWEQNMIMTFKVRVNVKVQIHLNYNIEHSIDSKYIDLVCVPT